MRTYYYTHVYSWRIDKDSYQSYLKAYNEKNFQWLKNHDFEIHMSSWNLTLSLNETVFKLSYYTSGGEEQLLVVNTEKDNCFYEKEGAEEHLLQLLKEALDEFVRKHPEFATVPDPNQ